MFDTIRKLRELLERQSKQSDVVLWSTQLAEHAIAVLNEENKRLRAELKAIRLENEALKSQQVTTSTEAGSYDHGDEAGLCRNGSQ